MYLIMLLIFQLNLVEPWFSDHPYFIAINDSHKTNVQFTSNGYPIPRVTCTFVPHILNKQLERIAVDSESESIEYRIKNISMLDQYMELDIMANRAGEIRCIANNSMGVSHMEICVENDFYIQSFGADRPINFGQELTLLCVHFRANANWYVNDTCIETNTGKNPKYLSCKLIR